MRGGVEMALFEWSSADAPLVRSPGERDFEEALRRAEDERRRAAVLAQATAEQVRPQAGTGAGPMLLQPDLPPHLAPGPARGPARGPA
ncbi:hypothetical protein, partial [Ornithinimicrobium cerasi]|uniref:hypothetical protein n=1 Tax=Ornithinimicrobium cerasi TaxID=2248773 RepID=UPI001C6FC7C4